MEVSRPVVLRVIYTPVPCGGKADVDVWRGKTPFGALVPCEEVSCFTYVTVLTLCLEETLVITT